MNAELNQKIYDIISNGYDSWIAGEIYSVRDGILDKLMEQIEPLIDYDHQELRKDNEKLREELKILNDFNTAGDLKE
jgi:hypothetical protein